MSDTKRRGSLKKVLEDSRIPILPYTRYKGKNDRFRPWDFTYDLVNDSFICPRGHELRHTTTSKEGKRTYRSSTKICKDCPCRTVCGANENGQRMLTTHIWQEYLDLVEQLRKTERGKEIYAMRKKPLSVSLLTQKKSTPCDIHTTEVWPGFPLG